MNKIDQSCPSIGPRQYSKHVYIFAPCILVMLLLSSLTTHSHCSSANNTSDTLCKQTCTSHLPSSLSSALSPLSSSPPLRVQAVHELSDKPPDHPSSTVPTDLFDGPVPPVWRVPTVVPHSVTVRDPLRMLFTRILDWPALVTLWKWIRKPKMTSRTV